MPFDSRALAYTGMDDLLVELAGVLSVTLNRPDSLNSLTPAMLKGIAGSPQRGRR
jgi:enoyl-CoA hydratase